MRVCEYKYIYEVIQDGDRVPRLNLRWMLSFVVLTYK